MIKPADNRIIPYDPYKALGLAIIEAAVLDYKEALLRKDEDGIRENEKFFRSTWAQSLSEINTVSLMRKIRKMTKEVA